MSELGRRRAAGGPADGAPSLYVPPAVHLAACPMVTPLGLTKPAIARIARGIEADVSELDRDVASGRPADRVSAFVVTEGIPLARAADVTPALLMPLAKVLVSPVGLVPIAPNSVATPLAFQAHAAEPMVAATNVKLRRDADGDTGLVQRERTALAAAERKQAQLKDARRAPAATPFCPPWSA